MCPCSRSRADKIVPIERHSQTITGKDPVSQDLPGWRKMYPGVEVEIGRQFGCLGERVQVDEKQIKWRGDSKPRDAFV
jgi:hypothetical protein